MAHDDSEESQHFEQVLSRLDALMKRSQTSEITDASMPESVFSRPISAAENEFEEALELSIEHSPEPPDIAASSETSLSIDSRDVIPVLTEVYEVVLPSPRQAIDEPAPSAAPPIDIEALMASIAPQIQSMVEHSVAEALDAMHLQLTEQITHQIAAMLKAALIQNRQDHEHRD